MALVSRRASQAARSVHEPALDFSLSGRLIGTGVDEGDIELGAHQGELLGAIVGTVVDEQSHGAPALLDEQRS